MYYLYHIPGKKIGVTRDLNKRVTLMQGYKEGEYEVLEQSDDIDYISDREIELQQSYGYRVDMKTYKKLFNKMKINPTEQTSTFPVPLNKLKGNLMDNVGLKWSTPQGYSFEITDKNIPSIQRCALMSSQIKLLGKGADAARQEVSAAEGAVSSAIKGKNMLLE